MKKMFLFVVLTSTVFANAHDLKQGIIMANLALVHKMLNKGTLTLEEKKEALHFAKNIKNLNLQAHIAGEKRYGQFYSPTSEILTATKIGWGAMVATSVIGSYMSIRWIDNDFYHGYGVNEIGAVATAFATGAIRVLKNWFEARELKQRYLDSLEIEALIEKQKIS